MNKTQLMFMLVVVLAACSGNQQNSKLNSTMYTYSSGYAIVRDAAVEVLSEDPKFQVVDWKLAGMMGRKIDSTDLLVSYSDFFRSSNKIASKKYPGKDYFAEYVIHFESMGDTSTIVKISTISSEILEGREFLPSPPHFVRKPIYRKVQPSTIEEYEIVFAIGERLGEKMPAIKY